MHFLVAVILLSSFVYACDSTQRDIGSGNAIDVITITKDGINHVVNQKIESDYKEQKSA